MTPERYRELCVNPDAILTEQELREGYHFCPDWDYMLLHVSDVEMSGCCCDKARNERIVEAQAILDRDL